MGAEQRILFDSSGLDATIDYLKNRTTDNFRALVASRGNDFAFRHYQWSNMDTRTTPEEFWAGVLARIPDGGAAISSAFAVRDHILSQSQSRWLPGVLEYLPRGHTFDATVYLNLGYDNVAYGGDVALNLNHAPFHIDHREAVYYLMHELAHAGYLGYNGTPDLTAPRTWGELAGNVMFLTHLEGMGVLTPLKLRMAEDGLGDPDYVALGDPVERRRRVRAYFEKLASLEKEPDREVEEGDLEVYDQFSGRPRRLWYVAGCHMAQVIEAERGAEVLRELVGKGSGAFFEVYRGIRDPVRV
ncbi:MAG: hypothetical protein NTV61_06705 [Candidatus Bathyarchaeota archaeon]|nr:hypothetical protein [Candidatus Bathyarchaeota archaeon]